MRGIVKWFNNDLGYGFIDYNGEEVFVRYDSIISEGYKSLIKDERVIFDIVETPRGFKAKNVMSLDQIKMI